MTPEEIKALRKRLGMTQSEFACAVGVHINALNRWERDRARPRGLSVRSLEQLAARAEREEVRA